MTKKLVGAQLDLGFIAEIDKACQEQKINRSEFLRRAIELYLATLSQPS